ncbi:hypothetical protein GCM10010415_38870 [Streptomyces atrovirens]
MRKDFTCPLTRMSRKLNAVPGIPAPLLPEPGFALENTARLHDVLHGPGAVLSGRLDHSVRAADGVARLVDTPTAPDRERVPTWPAPRR